jgi:hypothetical protein
VESRIIRNQPGPAEPQKQGVRRATPCHLSPATMQGRHKMPASEKRRIERHY